MKKTSKEWTKGKISNSMSERKIIKTIVLPFIAFALLAVALVSGGSLIDLGTSPWDVIFEGKWNNTLTLNGTLKAGLSASFLNFNITGLLNGGAVQLQNDSFNNANFTSRYDARADRYSNANLTGFLGVTNESIVRTENVSTFVRTGDGFKASNFTGLAIDANIANDLTIQTTNALTVGGGFGSTGVTISAAGDIQMDGSLLILGNISNTATNQLIFNGSNLPSLDATYDIGNNSLRWKTGNFSGTVQASSFTGDSTIVRAADAFNKGNYSTLNASISMWNTTTTSIRPSTSDKNLTMMNLTSIATIGWFNSSCFGFGANGGGTLLSCLS